MCFGVRLQVVETIQRADVLAATLDGRLGPLLSDGLYLHSMRECDSELHTFCVDTLQPQRDEHLDASSPVASACLVLRRSFLLPPGWTQFPVEQCVSRLFFHLF